MWCSGTGYPLGVARGAELPALRRGASAAQWLTPRALLVILHPMQMRFRLFVQQHSYGAWTILVPVVPSISAYAETRDAALQDIRNQLAEHLKDVGRRSWDKLVFQEHQELLEV